jgi:alginate O-acetyltransferase complex protein AlgI
MLFNSIEFIIFFIVVVTTLVAIKQRKFQHVFILSASYFFFYYTSNYLIILLIFTTIWDYYFGNIIYKTKDLKTKKLILIASLIGNLGLLGFFKYADFAITQINFLGNQFNLATHIPLLNLALPIAISFYTFHSITYTVGIYRNQIPPARSFTEYAIFVAFFPQLVAGPILRAKEFLPQLREKIDSFKSGTKLRQIVITEANLKIGITLIALGFFKKMFIADNVAGLVNSVFENPIGLESFTIIIATFAFGVQIYCDFSGYTDIAIGAALILGLKIPINFNKPYFAQSPSDFWRKWHISLSTWLRDYLYIPLGGNKKSKSRTYLNLLIVMFLGGLWHGAAWNFIVWGTMHGLYLVIHKVVSDKFPSVKSHIFFKTKIGLIFSIFVTQYFVFLAWIPFRVSDSESMIYSIQKYIFLDFQILDTITYLESHKIRVMILIIFVIFHFISYKKGNLPLLISNWKIEYWFMFLVGIILSILFFYVGNSEDFIYFQF